MYVKSFNVNIVYLCVCYTIQFSCYFCLLYCIPKYIRVSFPACMYGRKSYCTRKYNIHLFFRIYFAISRYHETPHIPQPIQKVTSHKETFPSSNNPAVRVEECARVLTASKKVRQATSSLQHPRSQPSSRWCSVVQCGGVQQRCGHGEVCHAGYERWRRVRQKSPSCFSVISGTCLRGVRQCVYQGRTTCLTS